jgi:hypothetical protein
VSHFQTQWNATMCRNMIGSLMYLTYICFVVNTLRQYMVYLRHVHLDAMKHVLRYLKGTIDYGLRYVLDYDINLQGYIDSYWAGSVADHKSTSGSTMISWFRRKSISVALSMTEEE